MEHPPNDAERRAIMTLALMASTADGRDDAAERAAVQRAAASLTAGGFDVTTLHQEVILHQVSMADAAAALPDPDHRRLAYELCVGVCSADGSHNDGERAFLTRLRSTLGLDTDVVRLDAFTARAESLATASPAASFTADQASRTSTMSAADLDRVILHYAILNGALEILPDSLATMAIVPLQMKMVHRIGQSYGVELDRVHLAEFLATAGVGLASQFVEQIGVKLVGHMFGRGLLGGLLGGVASQSVSSGFSFATTYALGRLAVRYYGSGRTMSTQLLKDTYDDLLGEARGIQGDYLTAVREKARTLDLQELLRDVRQ